MSNEIRFVNSFSGGEFSKKSHLENRKLYVQTQIKTLEDSIEQTDSMLEKYKIQLYLLKESHTKLTDELKEIRLNEL